MQTIHEMEPQSKAVSAIDNSAKKSAEPAAVRDEEVSRFEPIFIRGEAISTTLLRDRGSF